MQVCKRGTEGRGEEEHEWNVSHSTRLRWAVRRPSVYAARLRAHEIIVRTGPSEGEEDE